jgi:DNA topoisomerase-3
MQMTQIERGDMQPETFRKAIEVYTRQITVELLETKITVADENTCLCLKCKTAVIKDFKNKARKGKK